MTIREVIAELNRLAASLGVYAEVTVVDESEASELLMSSVKEIRAEESRVAIIIS